MTICMLYKQLQRVAVESIQSS